MTVSTPRVELELDGTWTDVSTDVRYDARVSISRGRPNEGSAGLTESTCALKLTNTDGRYSPRNPTSPYYGVLGRNTPLRVSLPYGSAYLWVPTVTGSNGNATCPDAAALGITGDLDVRVDVDAEHWELGDLAAKYVSGGQGSWYFGVNAGGLLVLFWTPDGTTASALESVATETVPVTRGRLAVRATLDVNNGASGNTVTFYTADSLAGSWTQLGDPVVTSGTTSIFDSTAGLEVGNSASSDEDAIPGRYLGFELRSGIAGTVVANPDFSAQTVADTSFADTASSPNTWTVNAPASIDDRRYRFHGEVSEWPPRRDISGEDKTISIIAAGITRRLSQGEEPLRSTMFREFANPTREGIISYWPMEDGDQAQQVAASVNTTPAMQITAGTPDLAAFDEWLASENLPEMRDGRMAADVPVHAATGEISIRVFVDVRAAVAAETSLLQVLCNGSIRSWEIEILTDGTLRTAAHNTSGTEVLNEIFSTADMNNRDFVVLDLELVQDGSDVDWATVLLEFDNTLNIRESISTVATDLGTVNSQTIGRPQRVLLGRGGALGEVVLGHAAVADDIGAFADTADAMLGWNGETPAARLARLCAEEGVTFVLVDRGHIAGDVVTLGHQLSKTLPDLLQEAAESDGGILYEPRDRLGVALRTRMSLYSQAAALTLSCADHELAEALAGTDDDQRTQNDLAVKRENGSEYRVEQLTGPLNVQAPPDGVGRYRPQTKTLSLELDADLPDQATWRLHLGTVDEARYPTVVAELAHQAFTASLAAAALEVDVGDRIVITDPADDLPPDDISQLVLGYTEVFDQFMHQISFNCQPESPWHVLTVDTDGFDRVDSEDSALAVAVDSTDTAVAVATVGPPWTSDADDLPCDVMVGGERMSVTAVADGVDDGFDRTTANGWGTSPEGFTWTVTGTASDFSVSSSAGRISFAAANAARVTALSIGGDGVPAVDVEVEFTSPAAAYTGNPVFVYLIGAYDQVGDDWYALVVDLRTDGTVGIFFERKTAGSTTAITSEKIVAGLSVAAVAYRARLKVVEGFLYGKVWLASGSEPVEWQLIVFDGTNTGAGDVGVQVFVPAGVTNAFPLVFPFPEVVVHNPQALTVTRSVNGVVKSHSAGAEVHVAEPVYAGL
jgi:hypothetical protein